MPEINWEKINKTILVWGKFSDGANKNFASGTVTSDFIADLKPIYYSQFDPEAIKFTKIDDSTDEPAPTFGGFLFRRPSEPATGTEPWKSHPILPLITPELSQSFPKAGTILSKTTLDTVVVPWALKEGKKAYEELYNAVQCLRSVLTCTASMNTGCNIEEQSFYNRATALIEDRMFVGVSFDESKKDPFIRQNIDAIRNFFLSPTLKIDQLHLSGGTDDLHQGIKDNIENMKNGLPPVGLSENGDDKSTPNSYDCGELFPDGNVFWSHLNQYYSYHKIITDILIDPIRTPCMMVWFMSLFTDQNVSTLAVLRKIAKESIPFSKEEQAQDLSNILAKIGELAQKQKDKLEQEIISQYEEEGKPKPEKDKLDAMVNPQVELYVWDLIRILSPGPKVSRQQFFDFTLGELIENAAVTFGVEGSHYAKKALLDKPGYHRLTKKWKKSEPMDQTEIGVLFDYMDLEVPSEFPFSEESTDPKIKKSQYEKQNEMFLEIVMATDFKPVVKKSAENYQSNLTLLTLANKVYSDTLELSRDPNTGLGSIFSPYLPADKKTSIAVLSDERRSTEIGRKAQNRLADGVESLLAIESEASEKLKLSGDAKCQLGLSDYKEDADLDASKTRLKELLGPESQSTCISVLVPQEVTLPASAEAIKSRCSSKAMTVRAENAAYALLANLGTQKDAIETLDKIHYLMLKPELNKDDSHEVKKRNEKIFSIPMLLAEIIYSLHDDDIGFDKEHVAHFYLILMDMIRNYHKSGGEPGWKDKIRFTKFYGIKGSDHFSNLATYYYERCESAFGLIEYAKRIGDIQALSKSGATVYVIDDTIDHYVELHKKGGLFFQAALDAEGNQTTAPIIDAHVVYVTKDAVYKLKEGDAAKPTDNAEPNGVAKLTARCQKIATQIACRPLFFFEDMSLAADSYFDALSMKDIPDDTDDYDFKTGPDNNPLLILATALLDYKDSGSRGVYLPGGKFNYRDGYHRKYFPLFKDRNFEGIRCYADAFKQLWCFDDKLAKTFFLNRLWNIMQNGELAVKAGETGHNTDVLSNNSNDSYNWLSNMPAFAPLPLIQDRIVFDDRDRENRLHIKMTHLDKQQEEVPLSTTPSITISGVTWKLGKYLIDSFPITSVSNDIDDEEKAEE